MSPIHLPPPLAGEGRGGGGGRAGFAGRQHPHPTLPRAAGEGYEAAA
jgi:hypothetical protein